MNKKLIIFTVLLLTSNIKAFDPNFGYGGKKIESGPHQGKLFYNVRDFKIQEIKAELSKKPDWNKILHYSYQIQPNSKEALIIKRYMHHKALRRIKGISLSNCSEHITNIKNELFYIVTGKPLEKASPLFNKKMCEFNKWYQSEFKNNIQIILKNS